MLVMRRIMLGIVELLLLRWQLLLLLDYYRLVRRLLVAVWVVIEPVVTRQRWLLLCLLAIDGHTTSSGWLMVLQIAIAYGGLRRRIPAIRLLTESTTCCIIFILLLRLLLDDGSRVVARIVASCLVMMAIGVGQVLEVDHLFEVEHTLLMLLRLDLLATEEVLLARCFHFCLSNYR